MVMPDLAAEAVLVAGGGRAILLQLADPAIGHGVAEHSDFRSRPLDRLHATLTYAYAVVFGTPADIARVRERVDRAHAPVQSHGAAGIPGYSALDPELQLWVAATLYDSAMVVHERVFGPLPPLTADLVYVEYAKLGTSLQMPAGLWPRDRDAFQEYWTGRLTSLRTDAATRSVAQHLLHPRTGPFLLRAVMPLARLVTVGLLPPRVRELFELPWTDRHQRWFDRIWRITASVYPALPTALRYRLRDHYLRRLRTSPGRPQARRRPHR